MPTSQLAGLSATCYGTYPNVESTCCWFEGQAADHSYPVILSQGICQLEVVREHSESARASEPQALAP